jgi:hypothetical protein
LGAITVADPIDSYLDELERSLNLPSAERAAIREEIASHLHDERSSLITEGLEPAAAATEAIRRQGDAPALGQALTQARQTRRALLAAAGAGTWAAAGAAVRAWILGVAAVVATLLAIGLAAAILTRGGTSGSWLIEDAGWYSAVGATTFLVAAWAAGRMFVTVAARESHRPAGWIRPWIALFGGIVVAWLALVWLRVPQNLASVLVLGSVPVCFALAALTGSDRPILRTRLARRAGLALFATMAFGLPILAFAGTTPVATSLSAVGSGPYASMQAMLHALGFDMAGRLLVQEPDFGDESWSASNGVATISVGNAGAITAQWHDLRIEAWRALLDTGGLDRSSPDPIATAPVSVTAGDALVGSIRVDGVRGVAQFMIVLTGVAPDGQRDFLTSLGGTNTTFNGSALDWLRAP